MMSAQGALIGTVRLDGSCKMRVLVDWLAWILLLAVIRPSVFLVENGWIVKSRDHSDIYFVSAELDGPGFEDPGDVGTWATTSPGGAEAIFSVDDLAKDHTTWRDGTAVAGLSLDDDGAEESRACAGG